MDIVGYCWLLLVVVSDVFCTSTITSLNMYTHNICISHKLKYTSFLMHLTSLYVTVINIFTSRPAILTTNYSTTPTIPSTIINNSITKYKPQEKLILEIYWKYQMSHLVSNKLIHISYGFRCSKLKIIVYVCVLFTMTIFLCICIHNLVVTPNTILSDTKL